ncbi:UTRA domain-containing protein [Nakamurella leprariae]|uniref:UTRA domain-containing protein n=1 Tax=Nakamurella leprariae TaxID=2803911 RepID=A0A938YKI5_9ACTN|nr:UTRA domain-containing protein [Nakamurella leprariae]MBM9469460.1 UTRA domain-containing protein [Nakamurella leprariae]
MPRLLSRPLIAPRPVPVLMDTGAIVPTLDESTDSPGGTAGRRFTVTDLKHRVVPSTPLLQSRLGPLPTLLMTEQVAVLDGTPLYLRVSYLRTDVTDPRTLSRRIHELNELDPTPAVPEAIQVLFERPFGDSWTTYESVPCERRTAELLEVDEGSPILLREMQVRDTSGVVLDLSFTHYRGDRIVMEHLAAVDQTDDYAVVRRDLPACDRPVVR